MTLPAPTYDLVLLLDPQAEEATRAKILSDARAAIEARGELLRQDEWGDRALAYPIDRKTNADYHLIQFHAGEPDMLNALDRTLRITDGIVRFRIIKLRPGVPDAPDVMAAPAEEPQAAVEAVAEVVAEAMAEAGPEAEVEVEVEKTEVEEAEVGVADDEVVEPA